MTLEELQQQVDRDFKLDDTELDTESTKIPLLHNKYLQHFNKFSLLLKKAEYDYKTLQRHKWEYYTGKADPSVYAEKPFDLKVLKADVHIYMDSDDELQKADQKASAIWAHKMWKLWRVHDHREQTAILLLHQTRKRYLR